MEGDHIMLIIPSRHRTEQVYRLYDSWEKTTGVMNTVFLAIDDDDPDHPVFDKWVTKRFSGKTAIEKMNIVASEYAESYSIIGFVGNDCEFETMYWDEKICSQIRGGGHYGMIALSDGVVRHKIPNHSFITKELYQKLGFYALPTVQHCFIDHLWLDLGSFLNTRRVKGSYKYTSDIVARHHHPDHDKNVEYDHLYQKAYRVDSARKDRDAFYKFLYSKQYRRIKRSLYK